MEEKLNKLKILMSEIIDINHSIALLDWDQQVYMPVQAAEERGYMMGTLGKIAHEKFTSDEMGSLLEDLKKYLPDLDQDGESYRIISVTARDYEKTINIPASFIVEKAQITSLSQQAWIKARKLSDYSMFRHHLEKIVELNHRYVAFFHPTLQHYDVFLDSFEPGLKTTEVQLLFDEIKRKQIDLIQNIKGRPSIDDSFLRLDYDEKAMWDFSVQIASDFGYDWTRGRQDSTAHPFCQGIGPDDVRITSRWVPDLPFALLFGTMHETGHALYEQGVGHTWSRTALEGGSSLGFHESQSRMWENMVGRSFPFWEHYFPQLQERFKVQLGTVRLEQFYRAINKVKPSNIRVEADEATYNLHIMLRFEIEVGLLNGSISVKNLPEIWNEKMKEYLGIVPANDSEGVLQDIHWSSGLFGYFPTYALGNIIAAQLWKKIITVNPELENQIRLGDFSALLSWLRIKIHQYGRKYDTHELLTRITKTDIETGPYLDYLTSKYEAVYHL